MKANDIVQAIRGHHIGFPVVTEVVINDLDAEWGAVPLQRRIDALLIGNKGTRTAIEIKVTRSDYKRETEEKRRAWIKHSHRFVYAVPEGLIMPDEVPDGLGLWWVDKFGRLTTKKKCKVNKNPESIPDHVFASMCYRYDNLRKIQERRR